MSSHSTPTTPDVLDAVTKLDDAAIAEITHLQADIDKTAADHELRQAAKQVRLDQLNARFAEEKSRRELADTIARQRKTVDDLSARYDTAAATADTAITRLVELSTAVMDAYETAVDAERTRQQIGPELVGTITNLRNLGHAIGDVRIEDARLHHFGDRQALHHIAVAALVRNRDLVAEVNRLSGTNRRADVVNGMPHGLS